MMPDVGGKIESPFAGWPVTRQAAHEDGRPVFYVIPRALTPLRARLADLAAFLSAAALLLGGLVHLIVIQEPRWWVWLYPFVAAYVASPVLRPIYRQLLKKRTELAFTPDLFRVRRFRRWQNFDRQLPHKFALVRHDRALREHERNQIEARRAEMRGQVIQPPRYYSESYHVCLEYVGQRKDILVVFGRTEALAVLARLKACDEVMDTHARKGKGVALTPQDEWGEQPGEIPETA